MYNKNESDSEEVEEIINDGVTKADIQEKW